MIRSMQFMVAYSVIDLTKVVEFHKQKGGLINTILAKVDVPVLVDVA